MLVVLGGPAAAQVCDPLTDPAAQAEVDVVAGRDPVVAEALIELEEACIRAGTCATPGYREARVAAVLNNGYRWDCSAQRFVFVGTTTVPTLPPTPPPPSTPPPTTEPPPPVTTAPPSPRPDPPPVTTVAPTTRPQPVPTAPPPAPPTTRPATTVVVTSRPTSSAPTTLAPTTSTSTTRTTATTTTTTTEDEAGSDDAPVPSELALDDEGGGSGRPGDRTFFVALALGLVGLVGGVMVARDLRR